MVTYQILAGASEIHGVPVLELIAEALECLLGDLATCRVSTLLEDVLPNIIIEVLSLETEGPWLTAVQVRVATLEEVRYGVVSHIDSGVGERLNEELSVPRELSAETSST
jgi:hypothetical protein